MFKLLFLSMKDPGITFITQDVEEFLAQIGSLTANGGGDTPEPSVGAIIRAAVASEPGGPIFVFTDAPPSDAHRLTEATSIIATKGVRVTFALVNAFSRKRSVENQQEIPRAQLRSRRQAFAIDAYEEIATLSGGQILNVQTEEIANLASLVSLSAVQSRRTIFRRSATLSGSVQHTFPVDSSVAELIISISGQSVTASVTTPRGMQVIIIMKKCHLIYFRR